MTGYEDITQSVTDKLAAQLIKARAEFVEEVLEALGYPKSYQREHKNDLITVQFSQYLTDGADVYALVNAPDKQIMFWFERRCKTSIKSMGDESPWYLYEMQYTLITDLDKITDEMWWVAKKCAAEAASKL